MAHVPISKSYNTFVRGLVTEASPLSFPENASLDEENFELSAKGYRSRRLGLNYENNFSLLSIFSDIDTSTAAINTFIWDNVAGTGSLSILVIQVGSKLVFLDATGSPISENSITPGTITYDTFGPDEEIYQFAVINGDLVVANHTGEIFRYIYNPDTVTIRRVIHGLLVRDFWGVKDNRGPNERIPLTDYTIHPDYNEIRYNLGNQGWLRSSESTTIRSGGDEYKYAPGFSFLRYLNTFETYIPSRSDSPSSGDDPSDQNGFNTRLVTRKKLNTNPSPIGHYIIDLFYRGRSRDMSTFYETQFELGDPATTILENFDTTDGGWEDTSGIQNYGSYQLLTSFNSVLDSHVLDVDVTPPAIRCVAAHSDRIFYSGFNREVLNGYTSSPMLNSYVFYSQLVDGPDKIGKCYQEGDPVSIDGFDLVETDGGFVNVIGAATIIKLVSFTDSLLVFASNGVWEIKGAEGAFSATNNLIRKITTIGALGSDSIVVTGSSVLYFSEAGVGSITIDNVTNQAVYSIISENVIDSFYRQLPYQSKKYARGIFSIDQNKVSWVYNDSPGYDGESNRFSYNKQLNLDLTIGAFYKYSFNTDSEDSEFPFIASIFNSPNFLGVVYDYNVLVGEDEILAGVDEVVVGVRNTTNLDTKLAYLCIKPYNGELWRATVGGLNDTSFYDWASDESGPIDSPAFLETGFETLQDASKIKQAKYIHVHLERTENGWDEDFEATGQSSCLMKAKWDFADHSNSGKISPETQVYRYRRDYVPGAFTEDFNYGQSVITTKNKIRGRGRALTLTFTSEPAKNCIMYGWDTNFGVNVDDRVS